MKSIPLGDTVLHLSKRFSLTSKPARVKQRPVTTEPTAKIALHKLEREVDRVYRATQRRPNRKQISSASLVLHTLRFELAEATAVTQKYTRRCLARLQIAARFLTHHLSRTVKASVFYIRSGSGKIHQVHRRHLEGIFAGQRPNLRSQPAGIAAKQPLPAKTQAAAPQRQPLASMALWGSIGVALTCVALVLLLLVQLRELRSELKVSRGDIGAMRARIVSLENARKPAETPPPEVSAPARLVSRLTLDSPEQKLVRQYIKTLPPKPGAEPKIQKGDRIVTSAPVPDGLAEALPKLSGARFTIDTNGSIVLLGQGSDRADFLIEN
jgi:hypothetical protein